MSLKIILSEHEIYDIRKMINEKCSINSIAKKYNTSPQTISRIMKENNINRAITNMDIVQHKLDGYQELEQNVCDYYVSHKKTLSEVGQIFNLGMQSVERILKAHNIPIYSASDFTKKYSVDEEYFSVIDSDKKAYYLGLLYADGTVSKKDNKVQLALQQDDLEILEKMRIDIGSDRPLHYIKPPKKYPNRKPQYSLIVENKQFHDNLIMQGVVPNKSYIAVFPKCITKDYYKSFIRGVYDGDGCLYHYEKGNTNTISFVGTSAIIDKIGDIIQENLGIIKRIHVAQNSCIIDKNTRVLMFGGNNQVKKFLDWLYSDADIYMERKYKKYCDLYNINIPLSA